MRVLLVEDEPAMAELVAGSVGENGFVVDRATSLLEARVALARGSYALVLLDRRLGDGDGLSLLPSIRSRQPGAAVIALSALDAVHHRVAGLDAGADDYLTKPFAATELLARMRAALRRSGGGVPPVSCGALRFDLASREATVSGSPLVLNRRELALLEALIRRVGRVVQRDTLIEEVYGPVDNIQSNALDAQVSRLRGRLAAAGVAIHPVRGVGYMLNAA